MSLAILSVYEHFDNQSLRRANWFYAALARVIRSEVVLVAEVAYGDAAFQLVSPDVVRFRSPSNISQKVRVYNELLLQMPPECDKVVILDPLLFFLNSNWLKNIELALDVSPVISPFVREVSVYDPKGTNFSGWHASRDFSFSDLSRCSFRQSLPASMSSWELDSSTLTARSPCQPGLYPKITAGSVLSKRQSPTAFAWGFRREALERFGLYDRFLVNHEAMIFVMLACAFHNDLGHVGRSEETAEAVCGEEYLQSYFDWAFPVGKYLRGNVGFADNTVLRINPLKSSHLVHRLDGIDVQSDIEIKDGLLAWKRWGETQSAIERYNLKSWNLGQIRLP